MSDDIHLLLNALENNENEHIFSKTSKELHETKTRSLLELELSQETTIDLEHTIIEKTSVRLNKFVILDGPLK